MSAIAPDRRPAPPTRTDHLRRMLDGPDAATRDRVRRVLGGDDLRPEPGRGVEAERRDVSDRTARLAELGLSRIGFPTAAGGEGDLAGSIALLTMLGHVDLTLLVKAGVQWGLFGGAVTSLGTDRHHERHLPAIMSLRLPGAFAMTETGHGSNVQGLRTTATYDPADESFVIDTPDAMARKDYIGNAARDGRMAVVFAQLVTRGEPRGVHALMVPIRDEAGDPWPGVTISDCGAKGGLNGVDNGRLSFDHVRVPREALLNRYGDVAVDGTYTSPIPDDNRRFFTMLGTLVRGRVGIAAGANAAAQSALTIAVRYAAARRQFSSVPGEPETLLLDYPIHRRRLLPRLATVYALQFAHHELTAELRTAQTGSPGPGDDGVARADDDGAVARAGDDGAQRRLEAAAAGIKAYATAHALDTIQECREACGGAGFLAENRLTGLRADVDVYTTFEGDNTVLLQLVAKGLLTDYRDHVGDLDLLGTARLVVGTVASTAAERSGARALVEWIGRPDVGDRDWQRAVLADRAQHVLDGLARRLRGAGRDRAAAAAAFLAAQDHAVEAARVHIEHRVLEAFATAVERCDDPGTRRLLDRLCDLFALSAIERDRGWFLEHGRLSPGTTRQVSRAVDDRCAGLRDDAVTLVDGFAIPEPWIDAPMLRPA